MDDLIRRQDVIDYVLEHGFYCDTEADKEYTAELIRTEFPSAQQWIPWVDNDDRLKNHYYYLVTHVGIEIPMLAKFHDDGCYFEIISMYPHKSVYVLWENDIITAWMPLPEIYKGEE